MWGWFAPSCPLDLAEKTWTEKRMRWLADQFGIDRMLEADVILPTEQYFPDLYNATAADARRMMDRVCGYMRIEPSTLKFEVGHLEGAAGLYQATEQGTTIWVDESQLGHPEKLVATLAHELSHELLLGGKRLSRDWSDSEWITDLLPAFLGLGVFAANATVQESHSRKGNISWWQIGRQGYLPSRVFGYAFALFAFFRGEAKPSMDKASPTGCGRILSRRPMFFAQEW
jgi:hypothetical protein